MLKHRIKTFFKRGKLVNIISSSKKRLFITSLIILLISISIFMPKGILKKSYKKILAFAGVYTEEVKSITLNSNYSTPGGFKIEKSAKWIGANKAEVTLDLKTKVKSSSNHKKDIILIIDNSGSMTGEKLDQVKSDSKELVYSLLSYTYNKASVISFNSNATLLTGFSNTISVVNDIIDGITTTGGTNYNSAFIQLDSLLSSYSERDNTDLIALFLTDGYPGEDTPAEVGTYSILKDKYPFLEVVGIQYEMGSTLKDEIVRVSDRQFISNMDSLNNVLVSAVLKPKVYEELIIDDFIDNSYFQVDSINDISTSNGEVSLNNNKVSWDLSGLATGSSETMKIVVSLKNGVSSDYYPLNSSLTSTSKIEDETEATSSTTDTPVLKDSYTVNYYANAPSGCTITNPTSESHKPFSNITKRSDELSCNGYLFKGYEVDEDVNYINDQVFVMPDHDINIRGTWTKQGITKTMDGTIYEAPKLYNVLKKEAETGGLAKEYTGNSHDSFTEEPSKKIYHWYAKNDTEGTQVLNKNNVIFADQCWQMIRTTDTGGVKMIYNGEAENNQCLSTRGNHVGYAKSVSQNLASNYWYGTDYTYDSANKTFKVSGTTEQATWNVTTGPNLIGKYTCKQTTEAGTCATLYLVESYYNTTSAYVIPLNSNSNYSQFGTLQFNASSNSPTYVGYMYGDVYAYSSTNGTTSQSFTTTQNMLQSTSLGTSYWYADSIDYGTLTVNRYSLVNPYQVSATTDYPNLVGKYTFRSSSQTNTSTSVYFIAAVNNTTMYYKQLQSGNLLSAYEPIVFGDSITDNGDGTYTINNPTNVTLSDWYTNYSTYVNKYTCNDSSTTCANPRYTTATTSINYTYINAGEKIMIGKTRSGLTLTDILLVRKDEWYSNYTNYSDYKYTCNTDSATCTEATLRMIFRYSTTGYNYAPNHYYGSSVTWDGTNYTLVDPIEIENYNNLNSLSTHHYMCVSNGSKTCSTAAYIFSYGGSGKFNYITLENGMTSVSVALEDMLTKNTTNSTMKSGVDAWYKKYLLEDYDYILEDTIFCNDRSIRALNGWNPDGGMTNAYLQFKENSVTSDLSCTNTTDQFSISNNNAKLTYKVGLMSSPEMNILNNYNARKTGQMYWLASPYYFYRYAYGRLVITGGVMDDSDVSNAFGVRPAVSLTPGIEYSDGDGSMANPYIVDTSGN